MYTIPNLPPAITREIFASLCGLLPPPTPDTPEARASREDAAMAAVAALHPADAFEAELAVQIIGAQAHAKDCLRAAAVAVHDPAEARRCLAQADRMMRCMQSGERSLSRRQAAREKAEAEMHPAAMERAGYWFRDCSVPAPEETPEPVPDIAAEADQYAVIYPQRAAQIRALGGLPEPCRFGPPSDELVRAIVTGTSPTLRALDAENDTTRQPRDGLGNPAP
jgi:hypothetical protein